MNDTKTVGRVAGLGTTARHDSWWLEPTAVAVGFGMFVIYAAWRGLEGAYYEWGPYLSPFCSPKLAFDWWQWSPAILVLWVPALFRATCYYYRKAYYRAYFLDPPACAVGHFGQDKYGGESNFPLVLQNLHRYFLYLAIIVLGFLWYDAIVAFNFDGSFGIGLGSLVLLVNVLFLSNYTFGCHALRHLIGGRLKCFSCSDATKAQLKAWQVVTKLNEHHMLWAWVSLFSVGFADFYVRMLATGIFTDIRLF